MDLSLFITVKIKKDNLQSTIHRVYNLAQREKCTTGVYLHTR